MARRGGTHSLVVMHISPRHNIRQRLWRAVPFSAMLRARVRTRVLTRRRDARYVRRRYFSTSFEFLTPRHEP